MFFSMQGNPAFYPTGDNIIKPYTREDVLEIVAEEQWDEVDLLAHLIQAECGANWCKDLTQYLTGSVVINRVNHIDFPDNLEDVIFQPGQYSTADYIWNTEPTERVYSVAKELIVFGTTIPDNVVFQANFKQGSGIYEYVDTVYFCYR